MTRRRQARAARAKQQQRPRPQAGGDSPGLTRPASPKNADGLMTRWKVHGMRMTAGTTATITALTTVRGPSQRQAASAPSAAITATGQASGTKAAAMAVSRPAAQAARRAACGGPASIRPTMMPISGSSTKAATVPIGGGHGARGHREQRVAGRDPDPGGQDGREAPGGEERRHPGRGHAAEQQHVRGQPGLSREQGGQDGHHADVGRSARG